MVKPTIMLHLVLDNGKHIVLVHFNGQVPKVKIRFYASQHPIHWLEIQ